MNKHFRTTLLTFAILLVATLNMGYAQDTNLLTNPGFEGSFTNQGGTPARQVAGSWTAWHEPTVEGAPNYQNAQPEYEEEATNPNRVRSGNNSQHYFSFFATHTGGVYQTVPTVLNGSEYIFSIYIYVWSSTFDDLNLSQDDGDVLTQIGIDPTGGTDPFSDNILWSIAKEEYDTFGLHTISAMAESTSVTVFVRSRVSFPVKNSSIYLDDASLTLVSTDEGSESIVATSTPIIPTVTVISTASATAVSTTNTATVEPTQEIISTSTSTNATVDSSDFTSPTPEDEIVATVTPNTVTTSTATAVATTNSSTSETTQSGTPINETFPGTIVHTVRRGDTLSRIASLYGSTIAAIQQANQLPDANSIIYIGDALIVPVSLDVVTSTPTATAVVGVTPNATTTTSSNNSSGEIIRYTVQSGDTLSAIARRFNTSIAAVAQLNGIVNPDRVLLGQTLQIPSGQQSIASTPQPQTGTTTQQSTPVAEQTYVVQPGDNLYRLSLRFNVTMLALMTENNIVDANRILVGQTLRIPQSN